MTTKQRWPRYSPGIFSGSTLVCYFIIIFFLSFTTNRRFYRDWIFLAVPGTSELLVLSPMVPKYTIHNRYLKVSTTVTVNGFDARSVNATVPQGAAAYVQSVRVNNVLQASPCHFDFYDTFRVGADIVITVTADRAAANSCGASVPQSISTGGFATTR